MKFKDNVLIPCPERSFSYRMVKHCFNCEFYNGINRATQNGVPIEGDSIDLFQIVCGRPITRKMIEVEED